MSSPGDASFEGRRNASREGKTARRAKAAQTTRRGPEWDCNAAEAETNAAALTIRLRDLARWCTAAPSNESGVAVAVRLGAVALLCLAIGAGLKTAGGGIGPPKAVATVPTAVVPALPGPPPMIAAIPRSALYPVLEGLPATATLLRTPRIPPDQICKTISLTGDGGEWAESLVQEGGWECLSITPEPAAEDQANAATEPFWPTGQYRMFAMARGQDERTVSYLRLKLSILGPNGEEQGGKALLRTIERLFGAIGWTVPDRLSAALRTLRPLEIEDAGTKLKFFREIMNQQSYNLIVAFPAAERYNLSSNGETPMQRDAAVSSHAPSASPPPPDRPHSNPNIGSLDDRFVLDAKAPAGHIATAEASYQDAVSVRK